MAVCTIQKKYLMLCLDFYQNYCNICTMRKAIKWTLLAVAAIFALVAGVGLIICIPFFSMSPAKTGQIPGSKIYAVKNQQGTVYLIKTNNGYIMVDAASNPKKFELSLQEAGIDRNDVKWIFLTHSDFDHVAGLPMFPNAGVFMNEDELVLLNGTVKRNLFGGNKLPSGFDIAKMNLLSDGQVLSCNGTSVKCIKAPGHTNGSMVYLIDGQYLFTGDALKVENGKTGVQPYSMDPKLAEKTLENIKRTINSSTVVFTSHYGYHEKLE